jgi:hypothetical protein
MRQPGSHRVTDLPIYQTAATSSTKPGRSYAWPAKGISALGNAAGWSAFGGTLNPVRS